MNNILVHDVTHTLTKMHCSLLLYLFRHHVVMLGFACMHRLVRSDASSTHCYSKIVSGGGRIRLLLVWLLMGLLIGNGILVLICTPRCRRRGCFGGDSGSGSSIEAFGIKSISHVVRAVIGSSDDR
jgi:hypothetical protein